MEINQVFGQTTEFATSVIHRSGDGPMRMGECAIWLKGRSLGDIGQNIFVESFKRGLQGIVGAEPHVGTLPRKPADPSDFLSMIEGGEISNAGRHSFLAIDGFDDYLKLFFKNSNSTNFVWSIHPNCMHTSKYAEKYGNEVFFAEISN